MQLNYWRNVINVNLTKARFGIVGVGLHSESWPWSTKSTVAVADQNILYTGHWFLIQCPTERGTTSETRHMDSVGKRCSVEQWMMKKHGNILAFYSRPCFTSNKFTVLTPILPNKGKHVVCTLSLGKIGLADTMCEWDLSDREIWIDWIRWRSERVT